MDSFKSLIGKFVRVEISGKTNFTGILIDMGLDVLVLYDGRNYQYIPSMHMQNLKEQNDPGNEFSYEKPGENWPFQNENELISYRKILNNAKGQFVEVFVTGNRSIHGYITSILNDYIVFYSPVYKTIFISMQHLKWLTPYTSSLTPYTLSKSLLPVVPSSIPLARTFEEQIKKYEDQLLVFDMGDHPDKIGLLSEVSNNIIKLIGACGKPTFWKLSHLKSLHLP